MPTQNEQAAPPRYAAEKPGFVAAQANIGQETRDLLDLLRRLATSQIIERDWPGLVFSIRDLARCENLSLFSYNSPDRRLVPVVSTNLVSLPQPVPIDSGLRGWVARSREPVLLVSPAKDPRWNAGIDCAVDEPPPASVLILPVEHPTHRRLLGILEFTTSDSSGFSDLAVPLAQGVAAHAAAAWDRSDLAAGARRELQLCESLDVARTVQAEFLPQVLPSIVGYSTAAWWQPAEVVGGDWYDVFELPDHRVAFVVADVSGHGLGSSLIMASARGLLRAVSQTELAPDRILNRLNPLLSIDLRAGRFVTAMIGILDPLRHRFEYANAGHGPVFHVQATSGKLTTLGSTGLPLGIHQGDYPMAGGDVLLQPGDTIVFATDGLAEQRSPSGALYSRKRLEELVIEYRRSKAASLAKTVRESIDRFHSAPHPDDDMTLLLLQRDSA